MKRLLDVFLASLALILCLPLMLAMAAAVFCHDRGRVIFRQTRVGLGGREFEMLKFRSMVLDAERQGGYATADNDLRITPIGRLIRRSSLDELPQLLNVVRGDMSIVGPRPDVPAQRALYGSEEWLLRHSVRPGITGLAQSTLRSDATPAQRKRLDLEYARGVSIWFDLKIIAWTIRQILLKGGN